MDSAIAIAKGKIKVILTGATGMVGEGVLHECLGHTDVEEVLVVSRKSCGLSHPKLKEILHSDFGELSGIAERLRGYDACFYCLGSTSAGMNEAGYTYLTRDLTLNLAGLLVKQNAGMVFCYVSAVGADPSGQSRSMWARVKGRTEQELLKLPFRQAYMFRPGFIRPTRGLQRTHSYYKAISWLFILCCVLYSPNM